MKTWCSTPSLWTVQGERLLRNAPVSPLNEKKSHTAAANAAERRRGQENGAQELWDHREVGMARSERDEAPVQSRVRESSRRHGLGTSAGMASVTTATNSLEMEGPIVRMHLDISGGPLSTWEAELRVNTRSRGTKGRPRELQRRHVRSQDEEDRD